MEPVLLIDFGSTYTKVTAADISSPRLLGCSTAFTTVATDIGEGLAAALTGLERQTGPLAYGGRYACSSAAGGLRMVACGLTPELTAKAASMASIGAGAKVVGLYSYQLTEDDVADIDGKSPDILLLTGGTDGGDTKCILHNAAMLAGRRGEYPVIAAGNRSCGRQVMDILKHGRAYLCDNVMPALGTLNIAPAQQKIRDIFLERIIRAKGLSRVGELLDGILMPTPSAVLAAVELLADGCEGEPGIGDLMAVDLGGATTDVYSVAEGMPRSDNVIYKGLPEPYVKRTVEGDIGMRYSARGVVEAAGIQRAAKLAGQSQDSVLAYVNQIAAHTDALPATPDQKALDFALAALAIETATLRHAGSLEEAYTSSGPVYIQTGKDLTDLRKIVITGGALLYSDRQAELAGFALYSGDHIHSLRPKRMDLLVDKRYILSAMGLLSGFAPGAALRILKTELQG